MGFPLIRTQVTQGHRDCFLVHCGRLVFIFLLKHHQRSLPAADAPGEGPGRLRCPTSPKQQRPRTSQEKVDSALYDPVKVNDQQNGPETRMEIQPLAISLRAFSLSEFSVALFYTCLGPVTARFQENLAAASVFVPSRSRSVFWVRRGDR